MLRNGVWGIGGHAYHAQLARCCLHIHIAEARAAQCQKLHAAAVHAVNGGRVHTVVHKGAHGVKAVCQRRRVAVQLFFKVRDFIVLRQNVEPRAVIRFCIKKCDFFHAALSFCFNVAQLFCAS